MCVCVRVCERERERFSYVSNRLNEHNHRYDEVITNMIVYDLDTTIMSIATLPRELAVVFPDDPESLCSSRLC